MSGAPCPSCPATSIAELCWSPAATRDAFLGFLVPPGLLDYCGLVPGRWREDGAGDFRWFPAPDDGILRIEVWPQPGGGDPTLALELADTRNGHLEASWIVLNDLAGPRYHLDRDRDGTALAIGGPCRSQGEELRALAAGLAPNQVRPGLRLFRPLIERVESLARGLGKRRLYVVPLAYHNAIKFEHYGFRYTYAGDARELRWIDRQFRPGGFLRRRMDGSRPFRQPWMADTIRGRSWAIRDGVLGRHWAAPRMVKELLCPAPENTFPGGRW